MLRPGTWASLMQQQQAPFASLLLGVSKELWDPVSLGTPILGLAEAARRQTWSRPHACMHHAVKRASRQASEE